MRALLSQPIRFEFQSWVKNEENGTRFSQTRILTNNVSLSFSVLWGKRRMYKMRFRTMTCLLCILDLFHRCCKPSPPSSSSAWFFFLSPALLTIAECDGWTSVKVWKKNEWRDEAHLSRRTRFFVFGWVDLMVLWQPKAMKLMMMEWKFRFHIPQWWCVLPTSWMDFPYIFFALLFDYDYG